jgi:hypothetical protein
LEVGDVEERSLEEVEANRWGDAPEGASRLVKTVHELRRRPVGALGVEDLRLLVSQDVGRDTVVPIALAVVERDPLAEGDFYPGDLLSALLRRVPAEYWRAHPDLAARLRAVEVDNPDDDELKGDISAFRAAGY